MPDLRRITKRVTADRQTTKTPRTGGIVSAVPGKGVVEVVTPVKKKKLRKK